MNQRHEYHRQKSLSSLAHLGRGCARHVGGYSLIEAVVAISIITILSGILIHGLIEARRVNLVKTAAEQLAGHLREAATLAQSSIKAPGCGTTPPCSQYRTTFNAGTSSYTRQTANGFGTTQYQLPGGAFFETSGDITFSYHPPIIEASAPGEYVIRHRQDAGVLAKVCVGQLGTAEVTHTTCN